MKLCLAALCLLTTAPAAEPPDRIGDAWSDPRNPVAVSFHGKRLDLWSLKAVQQPELPGMENPAPPTTEIDRFVGACLKTGGGAKTPPAGPRTLARRLYFNLIGLPPTPEQMAAFLQQAGLLGLPQAAQALADALLASPHYGAHLARMWLDVVRYSDSNGFDWDEFRPLAYRYRDYVIQAFNADKPYDQFITEQLAGDELVTGATPAEQAAEFQIATGYLRLGPWDNSAANFNEQDRARTELLTDLTETTGSALLGMTMSCCRCHDHKYDPLTQADHYRLRAFFAPVKFTGDFQMRDEMKDIPVTHILQQGDYKTVKEAVVPGFLSVLDPNAATIPAPPNPASSGRRLALAQWIASGHNPFTARVMVNRIWQQLMHHPLVATPNDFGLSGSAPCDPALLDWLAGEFVRRKWSVKQMVRLIVNSATYQQAAGEQPASFATRQSQRLNAEPWRDALLSVSGLLTDKSGGPAIWPELPPETLQSNPAFLDDNKEKTKGWYPSPAAEQAARSIFLVQKRNTRIPILETFDLPENSTSCARRSLSTVAPQALTLLNGTLILQCSEALANRIETAATDPIECLYQFTLQRPPTPTERTACGQFLTRHRLPELCRVILNLNEFAYVD